MEVRSHDRELASGPDGQSPLHLEQVNLALQQIRQTQEHLQEMEARLAELTRGCASVLEQWTRTDEQHASAVAALQERLRDWSDIERRMLSESATRIQQFERNVLHEWHAIRQKHEEPLLRLDAQATRINQACLSAVDTALKGFERAEGRLQAVEQQLQSRFGDLTQQMREAMQELRAETAARPAGTVRPWALEEVVRLHGEMRADADDRGVRALPPPDTDRAAGRTAVAVPATSARDDDAGRTNRWRVLMTGVGLAILLLAGAVWFLRQQMSDGLRAAAARAEAAERSAVEQAQSEIAEVQAAADARIRSAEQSAHLARLSAGVLASPDLVRLDLVPGAAASAGSAQVLWSRARGSVLSASRLAAVPAGRAYQLWLHSPGRATSAGTFEPDAAGRASAVFESPAGLPRPVTGASVTLEPAGGSPRPTGPPVLTTFAADARTP